MKQTTLEQASSSKKSSHALGAANIRRQLKDAFPGVKFSVTSDCYSGGDSIHISWELGPTAKEVEAITNKYEEGSFDGMVDLYTYNSDRSWTGVFGGAKYIQCQRSCRAAQEVIEQALRERITLDEYEYNNSAWRILSAHSFPVSAVITGLESAGSCGSIEQVFRPVFHI